MMHQITVIRKISARWIVLAVLGLAVAVLLAVLFWPRAMLVDMATVRLGPIAETVSDQGVARVRQAYVVSALIAGHLERLPLEVGDRVVAAKTVVARIRPAAAAFLDPRARAQAEASVAAAKAVLASAQAQRDQLEAQRVRAVGEFTRTSILAKQAIVAPQMLDNAKAAADAADKAVRAAEALIEARRADLSAAESLLTGPEVAGSGFVAITSPASGVVTHLLQQSERDVLAGTPLVEIGETSGLEAQIEFLSQDAVKIKAGDRAEIFNWGGPLPIPAEVRLVEPQGFTKISALGVEEQRTLVMLQFTGPPTDWERLGPGYRVWGRVYLREAPSAMIAPIGTLVRDRGTWAVFRVEGGRAVLRSVKVGAMTDPDAEILSGLSIGDRLVEFPSDQVGSGVRVAPRTSN
jgi:HlyD family secretion protein